MSELSFPDEDAQGTAEESDGIFGVGERTQDPREVFERAIAEAYGDEDE
jgi:hypothetical protein